MATLSTSPRFTKITLGAESAGPFDLSFRLFDTDKVTVFVDEVETEDFTLSADFTDGYDDGATVTMLTAQPSGTVIQIDSDLTPKREDDLVNGPNLTQKLNIEIPRLWSAIADVKRDTKRSLRLLDTTSPIATLAAGTTVKWDGDKFVQGPNVQSLETSIAATAASAAAAAASASLADGFAEDAGGSANIVSSAVFRGFATVSDAQSADDIAAVQQALIAGRLFNIVPAATYTANGLGVIDLTESGLQAVIAEVQAASEDGAGLDALVIAATDAGQDTTASVRNLWNDVAAPYGFTKLDRIKPEWGGAKGDETEAATTTTALNAAAAYCAREGKVLRLSSGGSYAVSSYLTLPSGLVVQSDSNAEIVIAWEPSSDFNTASIEVGARVEANALRARVASGFTAIRNVMRFTDGARIGVAQVMAEDLVNNETGSPGDDPAGAIVIEGDDLAFDTLRTDNFNRSVHVANSDIVRIGNAHLSELVRGFTFDECRHVFLRSAQIHGPSDPAFANGLSYPRGIMSPGANGMLIESVEDSTFENVFTYNILEHGTRVGGGPDEVIKNNGLHFLNNRHYAPYGCGHKQDDSDQYENSRTTITNLYTEDVGHNNWFGNAGFQNWSSGGVNTPSSDNDGNKQACAIRNTQWVDINGFTNTRKDFSRSGEKGLWLERSNFITASDIRVRWAKGDGVMVQSGGSQDVNQISLSSVLVMDCDGDGLSYNASPGTGLWRSVFTWGLNATSNGGYGFRADERSGGGSPYTTGVSGVHGVMSSNGLGEKSIASAVASDPSFSDQIVTV